MTKQVRVILGIILLGTLQVLVQMIVNYFVLKIGKIVLSARRSSNGINESFGLLEKNFRIDFSKAITTFWLSLHNNGDNRFLFVNGKETFKF